MFELTYTLSCAWHFLSFKKTALTFGHKLCLLFTKVQECTPISSSCYSLIPQRLLLCFLHDGIVGTADRLTEGGILNFLCCTKIVDQALLLFDFLFLLIELLLHYLELFSKEDILRLELFASYSQLLVLLLHVHQVGTNPP